MQQLLEDALMTAVIALKNNGCQTRTITQLVNKALARQRIERVTRKQSRRQTPLTTTEMLQALGLRSSRTLRHWRSLKLIDDPVIVSVKTGHGRMAQWPPAVLNQCYALQKELSKGSTLDQVRSQRTPT